MPHGRATSPRRFALRLFLAVGLGSFCVFASTGCQKLPLRRTEIDPEVTAKPKTVVERTAARADLPTLMPTLPPVDEMKVPPTEGSRIPGALDQKPATPMLDAALARASAVSPEPGVVEGESPVSAARDKARNVEEDDAPAQNEPKIAPIEPKNEPNEPADDKRADEPRTNPTSAHSTSKADSPQPCGPTTEAVQVADTLGPDSASKSPAIKADKAVEPIKSDDWNDLLRHLRVLARERAGEPGDASEAWSIRAHVLDWLAGDGDDPRGDNTRAWNRVLAALSTATAPETAEEAAIAHHLARAVDTLESFAPLQIVTLSLCRKVQGYGQFDPAEQGAARPGQSLLVYCEMAGLHYDGGEDDYRSRLSSRVELVQDGGEAPVWTHVLGTAEDHCRHRRRDYYVNYRLALPTTLAPGRYNLRLTQTDLLANRSVSSSLPLEVAN